MTHAVPYAGRPSRALAVIGVVTILVGVGFLVISATNAASLTSLEGILPWVVGLLFVLAGVLSIKRGVHPAFVLMTLDLVGLAIAGYLASVELQNKLPYCSVLKGCEQVAQSDYARVAGVPVAVFGVILSATLFVLAFAWWRTGSPTLLAAHYGLSLAGTMFELYFTYLELFVIHAVCIWCAAYGISLLLRFAVALVVWINRPRPEDVPIPEG
jgi:uncharacterized membrane protein